MKISFIGIGKVGGALAAGLDRAGHEIIIAHDNAASETVRNALAAHPGWKVMPVQQAVSAADAVFLATPFHAAEQVLKGLQFGGKVLVDCTNPVGAGIRHGLNSERSGTEWIQELAYDARVVKAYSIYGFENFINTAYPAYHEVKPVMMIAGNDLKAKEVVAGFNCDLGFDSLDVGPAEMALHLEHLTLLWIKMVRRDKHSAGMSWAYLSR